MSSEEIIERLAEANDEAVLWDGFDKALVGVGEDWWGKSLAVYSFQGIIDILCADNDWSSEEALEWYDFNIKGAYLGRNTPLTLH